MSSKYDVNAIRQRLQKTLSGRNSDPDQFRPKKAEDGQTFKYRFYVLPPLVKGDKVKGGVATGDMEQFFVKHGQHWINNRPTSCPRLYLEQNEDCHLCNWGFDLMRDVTDKDKRSAIARDWMPNEQCFVNIYFPAINANPEELRGRVMYFNAPTSILKMWSECLERNDPGADPEQPEAWGVFFDETAAFQFELVVTKKGRGNSYEKSHFVTKDGTPQPMMKDANGAPHIVGITKMLALRHDPYTKIEKPDPDKVEKLWKTLAEGDDGDDGTGGFTEEGGEQGKADTKADTKADAKGGKTDSKAKGGKADKPAASDDDEEVGNPFTSDDDAAGGDALAGEGAPVDSESASTPEASGDDDGDTDPEIRDLLTQLGDDD